MKSGIPQISTLFFLALNILLMIFVDPFIIPVIEDSLKIYCIKNVEDIGLWTVINTLLRNCVWIMA
jgi:hypothetical protein